MHQGRLFHAARVLAGLTPEDLADRVGLVARDLERLEGQDVWHIGSAGVEDSLRRALLACGVEIDEDASALRLIGGSDEGIPAEALTAENDG